MKYDIHRFEINMEKDQDKLKQFINNLKGEVVTIIPNVKPTFKPMGATAKVDFLYIIEKFWFCIHYYMEEQYMEKSGLGIGVVGGLGLGVLLGSEFSGSYVTIFGAILVVISLISMGVLSYKKK